MLYDVFVTRGKTPIAQVKQINARDATSAGDRAIALVRRSFVLGKSVQLFATGAKPTPIGAHYGDAKVVDMRTPPLFGEDQRIRAGVVVSS